MDTMIGQMSGITPDSILTYVVYGGFFIAYLMMMLIHAIGAERSYILDLLLVFSSAFVAVKTATIEPLIGTFFGVLMLVYLISFVRRIYNRR